MSLFDDLTTHEMIEKSVLPTAASDTGDSLKVRIGPLKLGVFGSPLGVYMKHAINQVLLLRATCKYK
jgi:hypothetical protein